ncbi:MAG: hypothetical protein KBA51_01265 [Kiritimatiellae bacterium]|nr:hypothetical protein [Kiritimatiellia bacterium]
MSADPGVPSAGRVRRGIGLFLRPGPLVLVMLLWVVALQSLWSATGSVTYSADSDEPIRSSYEFGIGGVVRMVTEHGVTATHIRWPVLIVNLLACYGLAVLMARAWERATRFRRPAAAFMWMAAAVAGILFLMSVAVSRYYWGYYLSRPPVPDEIREERRVLAVIPIRTQTDAEGQRRIVVQPDFVLADQLARGREDPYYCLYERLLLALEERKALPETVAADLSDLPELHALIRATGILAKAEPGYDDADELGGVAILAEGPAGGQRLFLGVCGPQVSNDHYPYYEMLFESAGGTGSFSYIRGRRFFYDVAGMEGVEWPVIWIGLAMPGLLAGYVIVMVVAPLVRKLRRGAGSGSDG